VTSVTWQEDRDVINVRGGEVVLLDQSGRVILSWDGRDPNGEFLPNNQYLLTVVLKSTSGQTIRALQKSVVIILPSEMPREIILSPNPCRRSQDQEVCLRVPGPGITRVRIRLYTLGAEQIFNRVRSGREVCFSVTKLAAGLYILVVESWDAQGSRIMSVKRLVVI